MLFSKSDNDSSSRPFNQHFDHNRGSRASNDQCGANYGCALSQAADVNIGAEFIARAVFYFKHPKGRNPEVG
jgi:hypothetical protein